MADRHKRKVDEDSSIELLPPPSTQPPSKKPRANPTVPNFPSSLRPVFAPANRTGSSSKPAKLSAKNTRAASTSTAVTRAKVKGKAKAEPEPEATSDGDSSANDSDSNADNADNSNTGFTQTASNFKLFLKSQIKTDRGAARKETNNQGGKGPSARARAGTSSTATSTAAAKSTGSSLSAISRAPVLKRSEFRVKVVMILPYGVTPAPPGQRNRYSSPFDIRGDAFWSKDLGYLGSKGFSIRASNTDGYIFDDNWSEDRVFGEICRLLPEAAAKLKQAYNPAKHGPRQWLPCLKAAYSGKFFVSPADGPFTGSVMRDIAISGNQRGGDDKVSTAKIRISDDDGSDDESDAPPAPSSKSATKFKSASTSARSAPAPTRQLRSRVPKSADIISVSDDDSDAKPFGSPDLPGGTEPAYSRSGSPNHDLDQSFSELGFDVGSDHYPTHDCQPELPIEADYCWLSS
ncbi:hypothetical protein BJ165DRAFT_1524969 [Panaeolus papilionaceus]|nr:hypothetical protein BJ165DRAFT_1524969 [Panaeolus papilionaceus]